MHNIAFISFWNRVLRNPYIKGFIQQDEKTKATVNCAMSELHVNLPNKGTCDNTGNGVQKTKKENKTSITVVSVFSRRLKCRRSAIWLLPFILISFTYIIKAFSVLIMQTIMRSGGNRSNTFTITAKNGRKILPSPNLLSWYT